MQIDFTLARTGLFMLNIYQGQLSSMLIRHSNLDKKRPSETRSPANEKSLEIINIYKNLPLIHGKSALKIRLSNVETRESFSAFDKQARSEIK